MHCDKRIVALDLGVARISYCEMSKGEVIDRCTVREFANLKGRLGPNTPCATIAIEACREAWFVIDRLKEWGHEPVLIDTTRSRALGIGQHGRKTDRIDAEVLARALEAGRIPLAHVLSPDRRELRYHLNVRRALVDSRAQYVVMIRGLARAAGAKIKPCDTSLFTRRLREAVLPEATRALVEPLATIIDFLNQQLELVATKLSKLCEQEPAIKLLATAPGVAQIIAAHFVSVIDDPHRFRSAHQVEAYLGLVPSEDSSGGRRRIGSITKEGNALLRTVLIQGAWSILRSKNNDNPLCVWGRLLAERRGRRIAVVAIARRLTGILWAMWRRDRPFDAHRLGVASANGIRATVNQKERDANAIAQATHRSKSKETRTATKAAKEVRSN